MMKKGKYSIRSYMTMEYEFSGIRLQDGFLTPVYWTMTANLVAPEKKGRKKEDAEYIASLTYQRLYFWLETNLPNITVVNITNPSDFYIANILSNITMHCPDNPSDDLIAQLLHSKLTALSDHELLVGELHLKGSDTSLQYTFDSQDGSYSLPLKTTDYLTEAKTKNNEPWWSRNDGFCFEICKPDDETLSDDEYYASFKDPMDEFERIVSDAYNTSVGTTKEPAKIVQVDKWIPKTVD